MSARSRTRRHLERRAKREGAAAHASGVDFHNNPYHAGRSPSWLYSAWEIGYCRAAKIVMSADRVSAILDMTEVRRAQVLGCLHNASVYKAQAALTYILYTFRARYLRRFRAQAHARLANRLLTWWQAFGYNSDPTKDLNAREGDPDLDMAKVMLDKLDAEPMSAGEGWRSSTEVQRAQVLGCLHNASVTAACGVAVGEGATRCRKHGGADATPPEPVNVISAVDWYSATKGA